MTRKVNGGAEWAFDDGTGAGGSVRSGMPALGELRRVGLENGKTTTVASSGHDRAEMIEMTDCRMKGQGGSTRREVRVSSARRS